MLMEPKTLVVVFMMPDSRFALSSVCRITLTVFIMVAWSGLEDHCHFGILAIE